MKYQKYFDEYELSHTHQTNVKLHNICVPLIAWSLLGFSHTFIIFDSIPFSYIFAAITFLTYISFKSLRLLMIIGICIGLSFLSYAVIPSLRIFCILSFFLGWFGQFYGHYVEGKKPSFLKDIQFFLIGPVWVIKKIYPKALEPLSMNQTKKNLF